MLTLLLITTVFADTWTNPFPGVELLERTVSGSTPQEIHVAYVSLCQEGLAPRATKYSERGVTTSSWAKNVGASVAINGAFFNYSGYEAIGWSIGDGETWPTAVDYSDYNAVAFGSYARAEIFDPDVSLPTGEYWWTEMVPGWPLIVDDGSLVENDCGPHFCDRHPRTAVGLTADNETAILVVVDGRTSTAKGMTTKELGQLMIELGAYRAMNLDGGGSSTLYVSGQGVVNNPSDGSERVVSSHLGFVLNTGSEPCCVAEAVSGANGIFGDIPDDHWGIGYAEALYNEGVTNGCSSSPLLFCPDCIVPRAHAAAFLARALNLPTEPAHSFSDVDPSEWYAGYIEAIATAGITAGCGNGEFCPEDLLTRWQAAVFVFRSMGLTSSTVTGVFPDLTEDEAAYVEPLVEACVVSGYPDGNFYPDKEITRIEFAAMLSRGLSLGSYGPCSEDDTGIFDTSSDTSDDTSEDTDTEDTDTEDPNDTSDTDDTNTDTKSKKSHLGCSCNGTGTGSIYLIPFVAFLLNRRYQTK